MDYLVLHGRAALLGGPLFCHLFQLCMYFCRLKIYFFFIFHIGCVCCWLFVVISSQIQVQDLIGGLGSSILIFVDFMPIWTSWLWLNRIMVFWFLRSLKCLIAAVSQSSTSLHGFGCSQQMLRNSTPGAQGMALCARKGFRSFRQNKLECSCHASCVFRICCK